MLTSEQTMLRRWKDFEDLLNEENDRGGWMEESWVREFR